MSLKRLLLILVPLVATYGLVKSRLDEHRVERRSKLDIRYLPSPRIAKATAIGFDTAMADIFWIEALNYYGWQLTNKSRTYQYLDAYLKLILHLDKYFTMFYEWASTVFIYNGFEISRSSIVNSQRYVNEGIRNLAQVQRFDANIWSKGAFNYALEANDPSQSIPFFEFAGRAFLDRRDLLLVGSTYAGLAGLDDISLRLKLEFLGFIAFEARDRKQLDEAIALITSPRFNKNVGNFILNLRVRMEQDEELRKLVKSRWQASPLFNEMGFESLNLNRNPLLEKILNVDLSRNWMPADLHLLISL